MDKTMDVNEMLDGRKQRYGEFETHANICQTLKQDMQERSGWDELVSDQREALEMIAHKIARILNGDPNYDDNWVDIAGYAMLVANRLRRSQEGGNGGS